MQTVYHRKLPYHQDNLSSKLYMCDVNLDFVVSKRKVSIGGEVVYKFTMCNGEVFYSDYDWFDKNILCNKIGK